MDDTFWTEKMAAREQGCRQFMATGEGTFPSVIITGRRWFASPLQEEIASAAGMRSVWITDLDGDEALSSPGWRLSHFTWTGSLYAGYHGVDVTEWALVGAYLLTKAMSPVQSMHRYYSSKDQKAAVKADFRLVQRHAAGLVVSIREGNIPSGNIEVHGYELLMQTREGASASKRAAAALDGERTFWERAAAGTAAIVQSLRG